MTLNQQNRKERNDQEAAVPLWWSDRDALLEVLAAALQNADMKGSAAVIARLAVVSPRDAELIQVLVDNGGRS